MSAHAEGWAVDFHGRRMARRQHYFLRGRSLCGKRQLNCEQLLHEEPVGSDTPLPGLWPCCAKCQARSSTHRFARKRARRKRGYW